MAIGYIKVKRTISVGKYPRDKFFARVFREKPIDLSGNAKKIAGHSALREEDVFSFAGKAITLGLHGKC